LRVSGMGEALVRRRLGILRDVMVECNLSLVPRFVTSAENKADCLTRVPKHWLRSEACAAVEADSCGGRRAISEAHNVIHCGVEKTQYLTKVCFPGTEISREDVEQVVKECWRCKTIDPNPIHWEEGELCVKENWMRLACDVTHYEGRKYLTIVDSGPSRFAVWKWINDESAQTVTSNFETVFLEFGPPEELLLDNSASFKSELLTAMCQRWNVRIRYRAAYRASGNAIVERHHSTVKRMAARARMSVLEAAFLLQLPSSRRTDCRFLPLPEDLSPSLEVPFTATKTGKNNLFVENKSPDW